MTITAEEVFYGSIYKDFCFLGKSRKRYKREQYIYPNQVIGHASQKNN